MGHERKKEKRLKLRNSKSQKVKTTVKNNGEE